MNKQELLSGIRAYSDADKTAIDVQWQAQLAQNHHKIIVLDDDPTGVQTVHGVNVYTRWDQQEMLRGFSENERLFFILTNSRSFSQTRTIDVHREIAKNALYASKQTGCPFLLISRGDSTLRGHYPLETETLREALEADEVIHGEVIMPYFGEGNRYTIDNIHYLEQDGELVPVAETGYAKDQTFGYHHSHLGQWVEEKTEGRYLAETTRYVTLDMLRNGKTAEIRQILTETKGFGKIVVNTAEDTDVKQFTILLLQAMAEGKRFLFRTAASFPKIMGGIVDRPLLKPDEVVMQSKAGGLVIVGSHVEKTTKQMAELMKLGAIDPVELNQHLVLDAQLFDQEVKRVIAHCQERIKAGVTCAVFTRRERLDVGGGKERELEVAVQISGGISSLVKELEVTPKFLIAKGGITSSEIATVGMGVTKAVVLGQIRLGVPVWKILSSDKFTGMPYIIFPGNVGSDDDLKNVVQELIEHKA